MINLKKSQWFIIILIIISVFTYIRNGRAISNLYPIKERDYLESSNINILSESFNEDLPVYKVIYNLYTSDSSINIKLNHKPKSIPVLMYHSINPISTNNLIVPPDEFDAQMKWLKDNNYNPLTLDELYHWLVHSNETKENPIVITFDDGYEDNYKYAYPILKKYQFNATIFLITDAINKNTVLTESQIKEMYAHNIDFQSHTSNHEELNTKSYNQQIQSIKKSQERINSLINKKSEYLCYPVGKYNKDTLKACNDLGIKLAFTTKPGFIYTNNDKYTLRRLRVSPSKNIKSFASLLINESIKNKNNHNENKISNFENNSSNNKNYNLFNNKEKLLRF